jgi:small-conductance mechanosensitive channel
MVWIHTNTNKAGLDSSNISDFLVFIYETLNKYEIEIPFPQMDVHLKKEIEEIKES